jgi:hypothetical protein
LVKVSLHAIDLIADVLFCGVVVEDLKFDELQELRLDLFPQSKYLQACSLFKSDCLPGDEVVDI